MFNCSLCRCQSAELLPFTSEATTEGLCFQYNHTNLFDWQEDCTWADEGSVLGETLLKPPSFHLPDTGPGPGLDSGAVGWFHR